MDRRSLTLLLLSTVLAPLVCICGPGPAASADTPVTGAAPAATGPGAPAAPQPQHALTTPIHTTSGTGASGRYPDAVPRYHTGERLICSDCHLTASASPSAAATAATFNRAFPAGSSIALASAGPAAPRSGASGMGEATSPASNPWMLKADDPLDLCLGCHDGMVYVPDVVGADVNGLSQRSAGHFDVPEAHNYHGHTLGRNLPGEDQLCTRCHSGGTRKVTCIDCHDPHGGKVARNLKWASDPAGTPDLGLFVNPAATGMSRYEDFNVSFGTLGNGQLREVSNMCLDCHHTLSGSEHATRPGASGFVRHPSYDSERGAANTIAMGSSGGHTAPSHWLSGSGSGFGPTPRVRTVSPGATDFVSARRVAAGNGVFCLSCHRAHGSDQPFGLVWEASQGSGPAGCDQCHAVAETGPLAGGSSSGGRDRNSRLADAGASTDDPAALTLPAAASKIRPSQKH